MKFCTDITYIFVQRKIYRLYFISIIDREIFTLKLKKYIAVQSSRDQLVQIYLYIFLFYYFNYNLIIKIIELLFNSWRSLQ